MEEKKKQEAVEPIRVKVESSSHFGLKTISTLAIIIGVIAIPIGAFIYYIKTPAGGYYDGIEYTLQIRAYGAAIFQGGLAFVMFGLIGKCLDDIRKAVEKIAKKE